MKGSRSGGLSCSISTFVRSEGMKFSVVIITYNEEANIGRCIQSVQEIADEVVVVDSFSTDRTSEIVAEYGARFVQNKFVGHIEQKNWAIGQARNTWVLSLDADEALDERLKAEIRSAMCDQPIADGFSMNRMTNYCGQWIKHGGWYPDVKLRLWDSSKGKWGGVNPHDRFEMNDGCITSHLEGNILHYSFSTEEEHDEQISYFTDISAKALADQGKHVSILRPFIAGVAKFIRDYIIRLGFLDGTAGWTIATKSAWAKHQKYAKLRRLNKS